jgi:hypothetical protein
LFIIEAESIVIFCPMLQFGCFRACSSVACSMSAGAQVRNGPPDAVMMTRVSLEQRVVLGIRRQDAGAGLLGPLHEDVPGADQALLVGERDGGAAIDRGKRRLQSGRTADRRHHPIRRPSGRLDDGALPGPAFDPGSSQRVLELGKLRRIGNRSEPRAELLGELGQPLDVAVRGQRLDPVTVARATQQIHRAVANRAGGTEDGHGPCGRCRHGLVVTQRNCAHLITKP